MEAPWFNQLAGPFMKFVPGPRQILSATCIEMTGVHAGAMETTNDLQAPTTSPFFRVEVELKGTGAQTIDEAVPRSHRIITDLNRFVFLRGRRRRDNVDVFTTADRDIIKDAIQAYIDEQAAAENEPHEDF